MEPKLDRVVRIALERCKRVKTLLDNIQDGNSKIDESIEQISKVQEKILEKLRKNES